MSLTNPGHVVTEQRLAEFYQQIYPYLGGGGGTGSSATIYGFRISNLESNPSEKIIYLADAVGMTPAHMDFTNDVFDYGSWENAFFMPKPCMLKYDGTVDYYLDPNDYTKKLDGTASDVANDSYEGNAMMEWPKIWLKIVPDTAQNNKSVIIYISDQNVDGTYTDWPFHNSDGESVDHFYTGIYNGCLISNKLRSISGKQSLSISNAQQALGYAESNNPTGSLIWTYSVIADRQLINFLLFLMFKTTNLQLALGEGLSGGDGTTTDIVNTFRTGVHNSKGLFYGTNSASSSTSNNAVKVFGMENWWGFMYTIYLGELSVNGIRKYKFTYNKEDSSGVVGYNFTGDGYLNFNLLSEIQAGKYITEMQFNSYGMFPSNTNDSSSSSTYYCDAFWLPTTSTTGVRASIWGGSVAYPGKSGPLCTNIFNPIDGLGTVNIVLAAKPLS